MSNDKPSLDSDGQGQDDLFTDVAANPELARVAFLLTAHPSDRELSGLNAAILDFRAARVAVPTQKPRRRPSMISSLAGAKLGATIAGIAVGLGGAATVAYVSTSTNVTPNSHATAAATPTHSPSATETESADAKSADSTAAPVGPDATGAAAYGLCTAWKHVADSGKAMDAVAFKNLATAAGGKDKIAAFCATVKVPGKADEHATAKPSDVPTGKRATPTAKAGEHTGKPTTIPTAPETHPTGRS